MVYEFTYKPDARIESLLRQTEERLIDRHQEMLEKFRCGILAQAHAPAGITLESMATGQLYRYTCPTCGAEAQYSVGFDKAKMRFTFEGDGVAITTHCQVITAHE